MQAFESCSLTGSHKSAGIQPPASHTRTRTKIIGGKCVYERERKDETKWHKKSSKYLPISISHQISYGFDFHFHCQHSDDGMIILDLIDLVCDYVVDADETVPCLIKLNGIGKC